MYVTFCGHGEVSQPEEVRRWLSNVVQSLIAEGADTFYLGGYGGFDALAASVCRELKKVNASVQLVLVLPYLNTNIDASGYDFTVYPPLESVLPRFAISKRNEWMVRESDAVVACVTHGWGGAAKTLEYAMKRKNESSIFKTAFREAINAPPFFIRRRPRLWQPRASCRYIPEKTEASARRSATSSTM